jgi:hypothetical protein
MGVPSVSIVTPTRDRADLLQWTLRSLRRQTFRNFEHIVIDGGSTDGTVDLLREFESTYPLRWISEPDPGMYHAINKGLRMAKGDVVAYLNSDDLYFPWTVDVVMEAARQRPEADLIYGHAVRVDEINGWVVPVFMPPFSALARGSYGSLLQPVVFQRRHVFEALGGFDETFSYVADMDYWLRAGASFRFLRIAEFLALEQRHADTLSETRPAEMAIEDRRMRVPHQSRLAATGLSRIAGHVAWHLWSAASWLQFVGATRGRDGGWSRTIQATRPKVNASTALIGILPSKASRRRRGLQWGRDPLSIAAPADS